MTPKANGLAQFFFEVGYAACFAETMLRNEMKPPFELSDAHIEGAWPRSIEAHEDGEEMDRYLALAAAAPDLLEALEAVAASAARAACDANRHPPLTETLADADALLAQHEGRDAK